jgi:hypothetical protein
LHTWAASVVIPVVSVPFTPSALVVLLLGRFGLFKRINDGHLVLLDILVGLVGIEASDAERWRGKETMRIVNVVFSVANGVLHLHCRLREERRDIRFGNFLRSAPSRHCR